MTLAPAAPDSYGHYEVEHLLGRGAMGTVYLARDRRIGRRVALKTIQLPPGHFSDDTAADEFFKRLQREAEVCGSLLHPNIVALYEAGYEGTRISYLAMELIEGETLHAMMKRFRPDPLPVELVLGIAEDILRGLAHAHVKGVIHRDIKPANILIAADGTAKIADFGIARPIDSSMTGAGALIGTPNYMPPEQVLGKPLTTRADLFSLGVVLYEMLTGIKPFAGEDITAVLHNIIRQEVANCADVNPAVPRAVGDLVARTMAKSSVDRPTAAEALEEIAEIRKPSRARTVGKVRRQLKPLYVGIAAGTLAVILLAFTFSIRSRLDSSPTVSIAAAQLQEFRAKRSALNEAQAAFDAGRVEESLRLYEAYLQKYPQSVTAQEGRDRAAQVLAEIEQQKKKPKPPPARTRPKKDEDISPSELLKRLRKAIRG
jgi:serine/threonine protein kinase